MVSLPISRHFHYTPKFLLTRKFNERRRVPKIQSMDNVVCLSKQPKLQYRAGGTCGRRGAIAPFPLDRYLIANLVFLSDPHHILDLPASLE